MRRLLLLFLGCTIVYPAAAIGVECVYEDVSFTADFEGARLNGCSRLGDSEFELLIRPEHNPINDSPWYAFRLRFSEKADLRPLRLHLRYTNGTHRYRPKLLAMNESSGSNWHVLQAMQPADRGKDPHNVFELHPTSRSSMISAQPLLTNADHRHFLAALADERPAARRVLGQSAGGRDIEALVSDDAGEEAPYVILLGRQHPPEIPGALALQSLLRTVLGDTPLARKFRQSFNLAAVPNLNPDGVAEGHWRLNANNADLNRDWGRFTQPETKAVRGLLDEIGPSRPEGGLWLLLDFHSTHRDVFYTHAEQQGTPLPDFSRCWLDGVDRALPDYAVARKPTHGTDGTTAKTWAAEAMNAAAVTYEVGDETGVGTIKKVARAAAAEMMRQLIFARGQSSHGCDCSPCLASKPD